MSKITFFFKDLLPNYDIFKVFAEETGYDPETMTEEQEAILHHCYNLLYRRYATANVCFSTADSFYAELSITFDDEFKRYLKRYQLIGNIYNLTTADFELLNKNISNYANNPNDAVSNPLEPLSYISSQTFTAQQTNKLQAYLLAVESLPSQYDEEFISKFKHLFMNIIPKVIPLYEED